MADIEEILGLARLPEKTVAISLRGDLAADWEELERRLKAARRTDSDSLAGSNPEAEEISARMAEIEEQMAEHTVSFRLRALGQRAYSDLVTKHAPSEEQKKAGEDVDFDSFSLALVSAAAVDPQMSVEQVEQLSELITQAQWEQLYRTALDLNRREVSVPFSLAASAIRASSSSK